MPLSLGYHPIEGPIDPGMGVMAMKRPSGNGDAKTGALDRALVERHRARAAELSEELEPKLRRMIERRIPPGLKRRIEVGDVLSGAFLRLSKSLVSREPASDEMLRAWIFRSVLNEWHDQRRKHTAVQCATDREQSLPDGSVVMLLAGMGVSTSCGLRDTIERIHDVVKPEVFEIIWLHAVDGLTYKEIGDIAGKPEDTIGRCYLRALEKIKKAVSSPFTSSP
jgi:RNA polymerase sigma factor (sigma-70 family)